MVSTRNPRYRKLKITNFEDINPLCNHHSYKPGHITAHVLPHTSVNLDISGTVVD